MYGIRKKTLKIDLFIHKTVRNVLNKIKYSLLKEPREGGVKDYLVKPFESEELIAKLKNLSENCLQNIKPPTFSFLIIRGKIQML